MKKRHETIIHIINWCLLFSLPIMLLTVKVSTDKEISSVDTKKLSTSLFSKVEDVVSVAETEETDEEEQDKDDSTAEEETVKKSTQEKTIENKVVEEEKNTTTDSNTTTTSTNNNSQESTPVTSDVLDSYTGNMSFYNANCTGCSGITSTGVDVSDGRVYYQDSQYGQVRIVAAGTEIKKWSIIRIKNSSLGSNVLAIVLDRGGNIGSGRKFLIDMLTNNSEGKSGVNYNITVEVLRNGK